jgi:hypothetical protein
VHHPCSNNECCQYIIEWNDENIKKLTSFFCLRSFCTEQLQNKRIIVKYSQTKKQWRIVVVKSSISEPELKNLQAYICENASYIEKNTGKRSSVKSTDSQIGKKELEKPRGIVLKKYNELSKDNTNWFKERIAAIQDRPGIDIVRKACYDKGLEDYLGLEMEIESKIQSTNNLKELNGIISQFKNGIEAIKTRVGDEIKQINEKGAK